MFQFFSCYKNLVSSLNFHKLLMKQVLEVLNHLARAFLSLIVSDCVHELCCICIEWHIFSVWSLLLIISVFIITTVKLSDSNFSWYLEDKEIKVDDIYNMIELIINVCFRMINIKYIIIFLYYIWDFIIFYHLQKLSIILYFISLLICLHWQSI